MAVASGARTGRAGDVGRRERERRRRWLQAAGEGEAGRVGLRLGFGPTSDRRLQVAEEGLEARKRGQRRDSGIASLASGGVESRGTVGVRGHSRVTRSQQTRHEIMGHTGHYGRSNRSELYWAR
ncbi:hypothetical protein M5K25_025489 [Dendrobium thyrsiflorum]|uniref:Uncharacterized protein n=1 Tax=Dendrobium thyrsiflorum TaxID=117978 RepID=A0ABD0U4G5_DENTH